jgi:hypothetical protein
MRRGISKSCHLRQILRGWRLDLGQRKGFDFGPGGIDPIAVAIRPERRFEGICGIGERGLDPSLAKRSAQSGQKAKHGGFGVMLAMKLPCHDRLPNRSVSTLDIKHTAC